MFIKLKRKLVAFTIMEMMIGTAVFSIAGTAISTAYVFSLRSFQALSNYAVLDQQNRQAIDQITREVRQSSSVSSYTNSANRTLTLVDGTDPSKLITYTFSSDRQQLTRTRDGVTTVLLRNCSLINFNLGMRPPDNNFGYFSTTNINQAKIVDLTWKTSRSLPGGVANSENIQTARIVIRKQKVSQL